MKRITFSQLHRISMCPSSQVLPWAEGESGEAAEFGTRQHQRLQKLNDYGHADFSPGDVSLAGIVEQDMFSEEAFAINVNTGSILFLGSLDAARGYPTVAGDDVWIYGTLDLWKPSVVKELKTGNGYIEPPKLNLQVRAQAYCAHRAGTKTRATICIRRADGYSADLTEEFDDDDQETTLRLLQGLVRRVLSSSGKDVHEGDHCAFCPAQLACPAKSSRVTTLMSSPSTAITRSNAKDVYLSLKAAKNLLEGIEKDLRAHAMVSPIELDNGKIFGPVEQAREYVDGSTLYSYIKERWGADVAINAVNLSSSKALLEHVLPFLGVEKHKLFDDLRKAGVLRSSTVEQFREHKRKAS